MREWAEFNKSCNLIGSGSGWNFLIRPAHGRRKPTILDKTVGKVTHVKYYESYKHSKQISYSHTILDKTVGKVSTFEVFIASLPSPIREL